MARDTRILIPVRLVNRLGPRGVLAGFAGLGDGTFGALAGTYGPIEPVRSAPDLYTQWLPGETIALLGAAQQRNVPELIRIVANHNQGGPIPGPDQPAEVQALYSADPVVQEWVRYTIDVVTRTGALDPSYVWPRVGPIPLPQSAPTPAPAPVPSAPAPTYSAPAPAPTYAAPSAPAYTPPPPSYAPAPAYYPPAPSYTPPPSLSQPSSFAPLAPKTSTGTPSPGQGAAVPAGPARSGIEIPGLGNVPTWAALGVAGAIAYAVYRRSKRAS